MHRVLFDEPPFVGVTYRAVPQAEACAGGGDIRLELGQDSPIEFY
jgi:hypothetical protein